MTLYLSHFGLREAPFKITPTTEFFYGGGRRREILHALEYAITGVGEGIMMVTGEVGSGKTMLLRTLSERLPPHVEIVYIANPGLSGRAILYNICEELEMRIDVERPDAVRRLQEYLVERHQRGRKVLALIDEAQAMPDESLEEIRLLSNLETGRDKLLQIIMFGQPELLDKLKRQNMRQLRERITVSLHLEPFGRDDIREYISTRLHAAGYSGRDLFDRTGYHMLAAVSQGLSRRINVLADKALLSAFERGSDRVLYEDVERAVKDAKYERMHYISEGEARRGRRRWWTAAAAAAILFAAAGLMAGGMLRGEPFAETPLARVVAAVSGTEFAPPAADPPVGDSTDAGSSDSGPKEGDSDEGEPPATESAASPPDSGLQPIPVSPRVSPEIISISAAVSATAAVVSPEIADQIAQRVEDEVAARLAEIDEPRVADSISPEMAAQISMQIQEGVAAGVAATIAALEAASQQDPVIEKTEQPDPAEETEPGPAEEVSTEERDPFPIEIVAAAADAGRAWGDAGIRTASAIDNRLWSALPRNSYLRARLNATEQALRDPPSGSWTARMLTVRRERHVFLERYLRRLAGLYPLRDLMVYPASLRGGLQFVVTYGSFESAEEARGYIEGLPESFAAGRPFPQGFDRSAAESSGNWR